MRQQPATSLLWVMLAVVALLTGSYGCGRYDRRLVQADSLMWADADSALAIVMGIGDSTLRGEHDRAYRDLLLTQARYKAYQPITARDDSTITRALHWYRAHNGEREKLTRATLYKGGVMEELGHVDSAMIYYKTAEAAADSTDYTNLGQINIRIARLLRDYYSDAQVCHDKYGQALKYFKLTNNKSQQLVCMVNMGGYVGITHTDDPVKLLTQASQLAIELKDSTNYTKSQELLCRQLAFQGNSIEFAKQIALHCLNDYPEFSTHNLMLDLAEIYAKCGMPDSAVHYLGLATQSMDIDNKEQVQTRRYSILSKIARLEGDIALSNHYDKLSHQVSDSISNNRQKYTIQRIENNFNSQQHTSLLSKLNSLHWSLLIVALTAALVVTLLITLHKKRIDRSKALIRELQSAGTDRLEQLISQLDSKNRAVEQMLTNFVALIKGISVSDTQATPQVARRIKETFAAVADESFWDELRSYLDNKYNGMFSSNVQVHSLTEKDQHFVGLCLCGFSNAEIAVIMDYSLKYISNKRKDLSEKLGIDLHFKPV